MSVSYHNSWDQYGFNMASIWLRYGFLESHMGVLWEYLKNIQGVKEKFSGSF
jgi:hypothetical protein